MLSMASVNKTIFTFWLPLMLAGYVFYLAYEFTIWNDAGRRLIIEAHYDTLSKAKTVDSVILGGSNSVFSISAELMSSRTGKF